MITFKKIRYKNLLSTGNVFTEIDLNKNSTTLIVGVNGSGKSTLLDALTFALFGKGFRKVNKPQLINSINNKELVVECEFDVSNTSYKVIRGIKPDIFQIYKNEELIPQNSKAKDYQDILEKQILKQTYKSFCQVVILGSATFKPFMQLDSAQRREIIEDLLDLQIFTTMNVLLKEKVIQNNDSLILNMNEKKFAEDKLKILREHYDEIQSNNVALLEEKKSRLDATCTNIQELEKKVEEKRTIIDNLRLSVKEEKSFKDRVAKLSNLKHQIEAKLSVMNKEVTFFHEHDDCPTCRQPIDKEFKCKTIQNRQTQIEDTNKGLDKLVAQYNETNEKVNEIMVIHNDINSNNIDLHTTQTQIDSLNDYKEGIEKEIKNIKKSNEEFDTSKITDCIKDIDNNKKKHNSLTEEKQILSISSTLLKDAGIKAKIIKQYVPVINKLVNKYLAQFEFLCQFELNEEFNEVIKSRFRDEFSYASFSEGEKMKIDIALLFTWRAISKLRNTINTNILIFDEILDSSMDTNSIDFFMNIIKSFTKDENIFIISHKEQITDRFDTFIRFEKNKNFSKIVSE